MVYTIADISEFFVHFSPDIAMCWTVIVQNERLKVGEVIYFIGATSVGPIK